MTLRPILLALLVLLAACAVPTPVAPGDDVILTVDGAAVPLFTVPEVAAGGGHLEVIQSVGERPVLGSGRGGTLLDISASLRPDLWDYGLFLEVAWDVELPAGGDPGPALLAVPYSARLEFRRPAGDGPVAYRAAGPDVAFTFSDISATPDGVAVRADFYATACRDEAPGDCVEVRGYLDLVVPDERRAPGTPAPEPILL